ncbi:hypothetical protein GO986_21520 [Deinococcus sp. HMF7620]|uniref:Neurotransmitter-gated ion-channel ligand-binding domain-containing protein n=1 Tax=Deinococcus arboris TaxID=2682977 RepID=A0A7C9MBS6_9DEIO|nr:MULTISPECIES: hypothetical protein [Deinococcus]MBZ9752829.1 hypothetical protein [Deinococcus betulae]MVN89319.1 hypothetical protein [Deinococcus arboris]
MNQIHRNALPPKFDALYCTFYTISNLYIRNRFVSRLHKFLNFQNNALIALILTIFLCQASHAQSDISNVASASKIDTNDKNVIVDVLINEIYSIDPVEGDFLADVTLSYEWNNRSNTEALKTDDPMLSSDPLIDFVNDRDLNLIWEDYGEPTSPDMQYRVSRRYNGEFSAYFDLSKFPFDTQQIKLILEPRHNTTKETTLMFNPQLSNLGSTQLIDTMIPKNEYNGIDGWKFKSAQLIAKEQNYVGRAAPSPRLLVDLTADREYSHYTYLVISLIFFISLICFSAYFFPIEDIGSRLQVLTALLLALTAVQFVVYDDLPTIPYLTRIDLMFLSCYVCMLSVIAITVFVKWQISKRDRESVVKFEKAAMISTSIIFCGAFLAVNVLR